MILEATFALVGLVFITFLPGYLLSLIILQEAKGLERALMSVGLSISLDVLLGFLLAMVGEIAQVKAITSAGVWLSLITASAAFTIVLAARGASQPGQRKTGQLGRLP